MRYFLDISYKGNQYHGWQIQPNAITIQEEIEKALRTILKQEISITGSGRTDAGVHASQQVAHFDVDKEFDKEKFKFQLNSFLSHDISINAIRQVREDAHARFDAMERSYEYFIHREKNPFNQGQSWYFKKELDVNLMNEVAQEMLRFQDFTSFSKVHTDTPHNLCDIKRLRFEQLENRALKFSITANRFLRGMIRAVVGTLVEVGLGKLSHEEFIQIIEAKDRERAAANAPAEGLFLSRVAYPEEIYL